MYYLYIKGVLGKGGMNYHSSKGSSDNS